MKTAILIACIVAFAYATRDVEYEGFQNWIVKHNKRYSTIDEHTYRFKVYKETVARVERLNNEAQGTATHAVNKFADRTITELDAMLLSNKRPSWRSNLPQATITSVTGSPIDYRAKGIMPPVRDQGSCGSCWAHSVVGTIECCLTYKLIENPSTINLSEQQLVDCDTVDSGCNGGFEDTAYNWIIGTNKGITLESNYPYTGVDGTCKKVVNTHNVANLKLLTNSTVDPVKTAVETKGPLSIAVYASSAWYTYSSGVLIISNCPYTYSSLNHAIILAGWGTALPSSTYKEDYWIVRNSWAADWGVQGYIYLPTRHGTYSSCGVETDVMWTEDCFRL